METHSDTTVTNTLATLTSNCEHKGQKLNSESQNKRDKARNKVRLCKVTSPFEGRATEKQRERERRAAARGSVMKMN